MHDGTQSAAATGDSGTARGRTAWLLLAGVLGFTGIAGAAMGIAKFLFWAAVIIAVILFVLGMTIYKKLT